MPVVKVTRKGVTPAVAKIPTDSTVTILPMTVERIDSEVDEPESKEKGPEKPTRVSSLEEAFEQFQPSIDAKIEAGEEGIELVVQHEFRNLKGFDPKEVQKRQEGKRNDLADLDGTIQMLHRVYSRFDNRSVKAAWNDAAARDEVLAALGEFRAEVERIAKLGQSSGGGDS